jgi:hypothetical protein
MLTSATLAKARSAIQFNNDGDYRTNSSDLRQALVSSGIRLGRKVDCSSWEALLKRSVIASRLCAITLLQAVWIGGTGLFLTAPEAHLVH